jgi:hypothetical protein
VNLFADIIGDTGADAAPWQRALEVSNKLEDLPCPTVFAADALCLTWGFEITLAATCLSRPKERSSASSRHASG